MLLPNFIFLPDGDVQLGTILPKGKETKTPDARRPLNRTTRAVPAKISTQEMKSWSWDSEDSLSRKSGVRADLSILTSVGDGLEGERGHVDGLVVTCDRVVVTSFLPDPAYIPQAVADEFIQRLLKKLARPSVYMVTGLMVAHGANIRVERSKSLAGKTQCKRRYYADWSTSKCRREGRVQQAQKFGTSICTDRSIHLSVSAHSHQMQAGWDCGGRRRT